MNKYKNKYRIASARAQGWAYGWNGAYFITICTKNRGNFFGEIQNGKMVLSQTGIIANILWHEIPNHTALTEIGEFVVMPNHIHGILILNKPYGGNDPENDDRYHRNDLHEDVHDDVHDDVQTGHALSLQQSKQSQQSQPVGKSIKPTIGQTRFQNIGKNTVSSIIGSYKSAVTKHANRLGLVHGWQTRFYDHIIRNDAEYQRIANYIINNPENWHKDKFYPT